MLSDKKIAIAILNYNGLGLLKKYLPSVIEYSNNKISSIYLIDNNSRDESLVFVRKNYPHIKIIENKKNYGYSKGYNIGLSEIKSEYYVLLNNDVEVTKNWLNPMIELLESNENYATCQPKIRSSHKRNKFDYAGASGGFVDLLYYPFCRGRIFNTIEKDKGQYDNEKEVFWSSGACLMIKSKIFKKLNGFDSDFFAHMEEIDLCWRLKNLNYKNYCQPKSLVYHSGGQTLDESNPKKTYLNFRNNLIMILKNENIFKVFPIIFIRTFFDFFASIKISFDKKNFFHTLAVLLAYTAFTFKIPKIIINKKVWISNRANPKKIILPIKYFFMGKKRFSDL
ncbi:MAG: glycosyltransferase family 2 protein [Flammeovirgaceae bacterium TMED290]|nr:MAG: glycosyltransferase family 2 protein [Flammeovirgaceae bacterium TMED290]|tara:strand:- start:643 stop:1656 length:1014 start_codon:yes stop_codon:yes gene_type:complete